jgi:hypothetical protein
MKKTLPMLFLIFIGRAAFGQAVWLRMDSLPYGVNSYYTHGQACFTLGNKVYYYMPDTAGHNFYVYDSAANAWSLKASFPGAVRYLGASFAIGPHTGYFGGGNNLSSRSYSDFYAYNDSLDAWTRMADMPDSLSGSFCFAIGLNGYVVSGGVHQTSYPFYSYSRRCYQYSSALNQWTRKNDIPWRPMFTGVSASVNGLGYCISGLDSITGNGLAKATWEYNPSTDTWLQRATCPARYFYFNLQNFGEPFVVGFSANNAVYLKVNQAGALYVFHPATNAWDSIVFNYPTANSCDNMFINTLGAFNIGNSGYIMDCHSYPWQLNTADTTSFDSVPASACAGTSINVTLNTNVAFGNNNTFTLVYNYLNGSYSSAPVAGSQAGSYTFALPASVTPDTFYYCRLCIQSTNPVAYFCPVNSNFTIKPGPVPQTFTAQQLCDSGAVGVSGISQDYGWTWTGGFNTWLGEYERYYFTQTPGVWSSNYNDHASFSGFVRPGDTLGYFKSVRMCSGCFAIDTVPFSIISTPHSGLTNDTVTICDSTMISFNPIVQPGYVYNWSGPGITNDSSAVQVVYPTYSGIIAYTVRYYYYSDSFFTQLYCQSGGGTWVNVVTPAKQNICLVTADSTSNYNIVTWENPNLGFTDSFLLYREITTNNYQQIAAIPGDSLSIFNDLSANPRITAFRYKICTKDTCGRISNLSPYHNTIHLQYLGAGNLSWNQYTIENDTTPVSSYDVYKDSLGNGNWQLMISVPGTQTTATDIDFAQSTNAAYRVQSNWAYACTPSRSTYQVVMSNILSLGTHTGVNNLSNEGLRLYPNPANSEIYLITDCFIPTDVCIYDIHGSRNSASKYSPAIDISNLSPGVYFIETRSEEITLRKMFIKL